MDDEALRIIRNLGLYDEATSHMHKGVGLRFVGMGGREFMSGWAETTEACGESQVNFFHQPWLEAALRKGVERFANVDVRTGWEAGELRQDGEAAYIRAIELASGATVTFKGAYVIAGDGGSSSIRKQLGVRLDSFVAGGDPVHRSIELRSNKVRMS